MKKTLLFLAAAIGLCANPFLEYTSNQKIGVQNAILTKVNGKTISMMDVKKKMDLIFHQNYPQYIESSQARFQFYETSWRQVLRDMIDNELIISDALDKEIKLTDGDVREVMEERFGPNVMQTLDKIGLTYDETWKMVKNELIVQRMTWWFVQSKAVNSVTPQDIRQAYRLYLEENPPYTEWKYHVISIRMDQADDMAAKQIYDALCASENMPTKETLKSFESEGISVTLSSEFIAKSQDLSETHKAALADLAFGEYSKPAMQTTKDKKALYRVFYLVEKTDFPAPSFEVLSAQLKNGLIQEAIVHESDAYLKKLRKFYGFDGNQAIPDDLQPFSLQ
ncbi:MAG: SurA N-terminal domain-containing protein [Parachlamydiales bacterium]|nr:SurA N-terminal domain-containing protein [Parachlamydiales bacterium]